MALVHNPEDLEFSAMQALYAALSPLDGEGRRRVVNYIIARLEIPVTGAQRPSGSDMPGQSEEERSTKQDEKGAPRYSSLAELYDSASPQTAADKALIAGYWLQVCQGAENFDSQTANKELKHLGHGLSNVTAAFTSLKSLSPALALQLRKSGKSQQARKAYKITNAGIKAVEAMTNG